MPTSSGTRHGNGNHHGAGVHGQHYGADPNRQDFKRAAPFSADNQPSGEAKAGGKAGKAEMRAFYEERRMDYARELDRIALADPDTGKRERAINSIIDRLDGKSTMAISGPDEGPIDNVLRIECDGLRLATRFGSPTDHASNSEPTTSEPSDTP